MATRMNPFAFSQFGGPTQIELPEVQYIVAQDIAKNVDYTVTVVHQITPRVVEGSATGRIFYYQEKVFQDMVRLKYTELAEYTRELMQAANVMHDCSLVIDGTGVGGPVFDLYDEAGLDPLKIIFTSGESISVQSGTRVGQSKFGMIQGYGVPKADLIGALVVAMEQGRMVRAEGVPYEQQEMEQYQNFVGRINEKTKYVKFGNAQDEIHDDIIVADAMAVWYGDHVTRDKRKVRIEHSSYQQNPFGDLYGSFKGHNH